jgi:WhiB family redox-sensing transcriptional regulator
MISETLACLVSPSWMGSANCRTTDPDLFYPGGDTNKWNVRRVKAALKVCSRCPVNVECLSWALETQDCYGILGGTTPDQRSRMGDEDGTAGSGLGAAVGSR